MEKLKSEGHCLFCDKIFSKSTITRHLNSHFSKMEETSLNEKSYHIKVEDDPTYGSSPYFLNLLVSPTAKFQDIDNFLREIWLECCGHLSSFIEVGTKKKSRYDFEAVEISMSKKVSKVFYEGQKIQYEYDFGTTTSLRLTVVAIMPVKTTQKITLLSRNEPLELLCETCKKLPATQICAIHLYSDQDNMFCEKCAKKHAKICEDFADYAAMPVVNSPRMGECAYEGGSIDLERDGVFVKKQETQDTSKKHVI